MCIRDRGYTKGEQQKFVAAAKRLWEGAMQYEPYKTYKDRFNVYACLLYTSLHYEYTSTGENLPFLEEDYATERHYRGSEKKRSNRMGRPGKNSMRSRVDESIVLNGFGCA